MMVAQTRFAAFGPKLGALLLVGLLFFEGCSARAPAPSKHQPIVSSDGFTVRLDAVTISDGSPRQAYIRLTISNASQREIKVEAKDITLVDTEGRRAASAEKLRVGPEPEKASAWHLLFAPQVILMCVMFAPVCVILAAGGSIAEASRHKTAVAVQPGKDETVSVLFSENPVRFDKLSVIRVKRQEDDQTIELHIADAVPSLQNR